jgi:transposase-like protein
MDMTMDMTMSSIRPSRVEVLTSVQRRRRWTPEQKLEIVKQTNEPGSSVSLVARSHGLSAAQLFQWRKAYMEGSLVAVGANESAATDVSRETIGKLKLPVVLSYRVNSTDLQGAGAQFTDQAA